MNSSYHFFFRWRCGPTRARASSFLRFLDHTQRRIIFRGTPLDEWSARRRDLYLTTHNTHNRQISMPPGGIRTHDLSRRAAVDLRLRPHGHGERLSKYHRVLKFGIIWKGNSSELRFLRYSVLEHKMLSLYTKGINSLLPGVRCVYACRRNLSPKSIYRWYFLLCIYIKFFFADFNLCPNRSTVNSAWEEAQTFSSFSQKLLLTYLLTPWSRVLFEKLASLQLVKKFPAFYGTRRFLTAHTSARHLSLSWTLPIQSS